MTNLLFVWVAVIWLWEVLPAALSHPGIIPAEELWLVTGMVTGGVWVLVKFRREII